MRSKAAVVGWPAGLSLPVHYLNHQINRFVRFLQSQRPIPRQRWVRLHRGRSTKARLHRGVRVEITAPGVHLGKFTNDWEEARGRHRDFQVDEKGILLELAGLTILRRYVEAGGVFTGSHVLPAHRIAGRDKRVVEQRIKRLTRAACGAYKVTEEADKSARRSLARKRTANEGAVHPEGSASGRGEEIELLISGLGARGFGERQTIRWFAARLGSSLAPLARVTAVQSGASVHVREKVSGSERDSGRGGNAFLLLRFRLTPLPKRGRSGICVPLQALSVLLEARVQSMLASLLHGRFQAG